jgi:hypothetical protein
MPPLGNLLHTTKRLVGHNHYNLMVMLYFSVCSEQQWPTIDNQKIGWSIITI